MWLSKRNTQEPHQGNESEKMAHSMRAMRGTNGNNEWHRTHEENHHFFIKKVNSINPGKTSRKKWKIDRKNINLWHHSTCFSHANRFPSWHFSALNSGTNYSFFWLTSFFPYHFILTLCLGHTNSRPSHYHIIHTSWNDERMNPFHVISLRMPKRTEIGIQSGRPSDTHLLFFPLEITLFIECTQFMKMSFGHLFSWIQH